MPCRYASSNRSGWRSPPMASSPSGVACSTEGKLRSRGFRLNRTMAEQRSSSLVRRSRGQQRLEDRIGVQDGFQRVRPDEEVPNLLVAPRHLAEPPFGFRQALKNGAIVPVRREQQAIRLCVFGDELVERNFGEGARLIGVLICRTDVFVVKVPV